MWYRATLLQIIRTGRKRTKKHTVSLCSKITLDLRVNCYFILKKAISMITVKLSCHCQSCHKKEREFDLSKYLHLEHTLRFVYQYNSEASSKYTLVGPLTNLLNFHYHFLIWATTTREKNIIEVIRETSKRADGLLSTLGNISLLATLSYWLHAIYCGIHLECSCGIPTNTNILWLIVYRDFRIFSTFSTVSIFSRFFRRSGYS